MTTHNTHQSLLLLTQTNALAGNEPPQLHGKAKATPTAVKAPTVDEIRDWPVYAKTLDVGQDVQAQVYAQIVQAVARQQAMIVHENCNFSAEFGTYFVFVVWKASPSCGITDLSANKAA